MVNLTKKEILKILTENSFEIKKLGVKKLILFGSYATNKQTKKSDIDFLVEYEIGRGLFKDSIRLFHLLEKKLFNKQIDLIKTNLIRDELKTEILGSIRCEVKI